MWLSRFDEAHIPGLERMLLIPNFHLCLAFEDDQNLIGIGMITSKLP